MRGTRVLGVTLRFIVSTGCLVLAVRTADCAVCAEDPELRRACALLRSGHVQQALEKTIAISRTEPGCAAVATLLGDIYFRKADFDTAERHYRIAIDLDRGYAEAHAGIGRVQHLKFQRKSARISLARAYALAPSVPRIVRSYASVVVNREHQRALLRAYLSLATSEPRGDIESAVQQLEFLRRLGDRTVAQLGVDYRPYTVRMHPWRPRAGPPIGSLVTARINGSRFLNLVFDTGADGIYLNPKTAEKLDLEYLSEAGVNGAGTTRPIRTRKTLARTVQTDDLIIRNCVVDVADKLVVENADGVIGARAFQQFAIRMDGTRQLLELIPYGEEIPREQLWADNDRTISEPSAGAVPAYQLGHLLLVKAELHGDTSGYFVVDSGAAYTCAARLSASRNTRERVTMAAAGGGLINAFRSGGLRIHVAGHDLPVPNLLAVDLSNLSNREGTEISGLLGYPTLAALVLTIDYRDGLLRFDESR